jgi:ssDNA-binding Zn-finger/Zn-ribbon topoisomerase 1
MSFDLRTITFPKTMPRKSLIEEFLDAGVGLLDELFGQEEQPRTSSAIQPRNAPILPRLPTPNSKELGERLRQIDWYQFEKLIEALYVEKGYHVERRGGAHPDGGVDLVLRPQRGGNTIIVQCKHWKARNVGVRVIRDLLGAQMVTKATRAILITLRGYHPAARLLATEQRVELMEEATLIDWIESHRQRPSWPRVEACLNSPEKRCPRCESPMVERTVRKGPRKGERIWGCLAFPRCRYVFDIHEEESEEPSAPSLREQPAAIGYRVVMASSPVKAPPAVPRPVPPPTPPAAPTHATPSTTSRSCPRCGSPLVEREARKGPNAGGRFLGCSAFPKCRHIGSI